MHSHTLSLRNKAIPGLLLVVMLIVALIQYWSAFIAWSLQMQITLHRYLVLHLLQINSGQYSAGFWLIGMTFIYGILHAVGPGHGKFIVTTWLGTHHPNPRAARLVPFCGSLLQGLSAIIFVVVLAIALNLAAGDLSLSRWWLEKITAVLIAGFGGWIILRALRGHAASDAHPAEACGCGHHHGVGQPVSHWKEYVGVIVAMGTRPCSGAITVLLFANVIGIFTWGMVAVMTMALGTALAILLLSLAVAHMRQRVAGIWLTQSSRRLRGMILILRMAGGILLILFAIVLFLTVVPVSANGDFIAAGC